MKCQKRYVRQYGFVTPTLKTGFSFADTVYAKEAARRAGRATLRMIETRRYQGEEEPEEGWRRKKAKRGREGEESSVRHKEKNRQLNIKSVYLQVFCCATYAIPQQFNPAKASFPTTTRVSLRDRTPTRRAYLFLLLSLLTSSSNEHETLTTNSSSRYFDTAIWSPSPFLRRIFSTSSRASACPEAGSSGRSLILASVGSPDVHMTTT